MLRGVSRKTERKTKKEKTSILTFRPKPREQHLPAVALHLWGAQWVVCFPKGAVAGACGRRERCIVVDGSIGGNAIPSASFSVFVSSFSGSSSSNFASLLQLLPQRSDLCTQEGELLFRSERKRRHCFFFSIG